MSSISNPFQKAAAEYLGIQGVNNGAGTSAFTIDQQVFIVGYQGPTGGGTSRGWEVIATNPDVVYLDAHSRDGVFNDYDYRMQFAGGYAGAQGGGQLICEGRQTTFYMPLRTTVPGQPLAPAWYADYGTVSATEGVNQETTVTFPFEFPEIPTVTVTVLTPGDQAGDQFVFVEDLTTTSFKVQYLGTAAAGTKLMYIAMGPPSP